MSTETTALANGLHPGAPSGRDTWFARHQAVVAALLVVLTLLIAASWLIFPYYIKDQNLIAAVGGDVKQQKLRNAISIGQFLNRTTFGTGEAQVDVLYATPTWWERPSS